jgi:hypothetical protein
MLLAKLPLVCPTMLRRRRRVTLRDPDRAVNFTRKLAEGALDTYDAAGIFGAAGDVPLFSILPLMLITSRLCPWCPPLRKRADKPRS